MVINGATEIRYVYDDLGQLIREDNGQLNATYVYTYDNAGNRTSKKTYALTAAGVTPTSPSSTDSLTYGNASWGDLLTAFNGHAITYDEIGNPITYYNGRSYTFSWTGRQLTGATIGSSVYSFKYNENGIRTQKIQGTSVTNYYVQGNLIIAEEVNGHVYAYIYDASGLPIGMKCHKLTDESSDWDTYWFEKNLQGDVVAVYDDAGVKLITYTYDAWGRFTESYTHSAVEYSPATHSPFRYRSYYYDEDLGMYYLGSRYYDSTTGRFINADRFVSTGTGLMGYNMFAYCNNNPVAFVDNLGTEPVSLFLALQATITFVAIIALATLAYDATHEQKLGTTFSNGVSFIANAINSDLKEESNEEIAIDNTKSYRTYYHSTTPDAAATIMAGNVMCGSEWEGGRVYAWTSKPNKYALKNSGAHQGVLIEFKSSAVFVPDSGINDPKILKYGPVMTQGPIMVWDVRIVE